MSAQSWLESPTVEDRLDDLNYQLATDDGMALPPDGRASVDTADVMAGAEAIPPVVVRPAPSSSRREPAPANFLGAVGYCGLMLAAQFVGAFLFVIMLFRNFGTSAVAMIRSDQHPVVMQAFSSIAMLALGILLHRIKQGEQPFRHPDRLLAIRHFLLLLVLVTPLFLTLPTAAEWIVQQASIGDTGLLVAAAGAKWVDVDSMSYVERTMLKIIQQPWPVVILIGCVLPAVSEEVFFRLFLGTGLVRRYRWAGGILTTSLLFGVMHFWPPQVCFTLLLGVVLHAVYLLTRSLPAAMLLHGLNNLLAFGIMKLAFDGTFDITSSDGQFHVPATLWIASLAVSGTGLSLLYATRATFSGGESRPVTDSETTSSGDKTSPRPTVASPWYRVAFLATLVVWCLAGWPVGRSWIAQTYVNRAENALAEADAAGALHGLHNALRWDDELASAYALRSWIHRDAERWELARKDCDKAIDLDPFNVAGFRQRCLLFQALDEWQAAVDDATKAIALAPRIPDLYCDRAVSLNNLREFERAIQDCDVALKIVPDYSEPYRLRAFAYCEQGDYRRAIEDCDRALKLDPELGNAFSIRGRSRYHLGDLSGALDDIRRAILGDSDNLYVRLDLGKTLSALKRWDEAIDELSQVIQDAPDFQQAREWRAKAYRARGRVKDAETDERVVVELSVNEHLARARSMVDNSRWSAALDELNQAATLDPSHASVHWLKAVVMNELGDTDSAIGHIDQAIRISPDVAGCWQLRAQFMMKTGNETEAIRSLEQAIRLDPNDSWAAAMLKFLTKKDSEAQSATK